MDDGISSFWGPVTSTIECCEKNYSSSTTISNVPGIILALIGLLNALRQQFEKRHQHSDETPMVWEMLLYLYILYSPDWHYKSTMPTFIFLYGAAFGVLHHLIGFNTGFKVHYMLLCLLCIPRMYKYYIHTNDVNAKRLAKLYLLTLLLGSICWFVDREFCKKFSSWDFNPQGHAFWHIFMGFNSYLANTFLMFCRAQQLGWDPKVARFMGFLPYAKIHKSKTQ
ncbi:Alkaline ceramidase [Bienertia sinuspersici]